MIETKVVRQIADDIDMLYEESANAHRQIAECNKTIAKLQAEIERLNTERQTLLGFKEQCEKMAAHPDVKKAALEKARLDVQRAAAEALAAMHRLEAMQPLAVQPAITPEVEQ